MPPITTVPPFSTSTSVFTCLVLIAMPAGVVAPGSSLFTSRVMMMLPSGVICGFTLSARFALRYDTLVAPDDVACWYGISVPCRGLVRREHARAGNRLALAVGLERRDFQVEEPGQRRIEQDEGERACIERVQARGRHVD